MEEIARRAADDAAALEAAGFDAAIIENYGDAPFFGQCVPPVTVASMSVVADAVRRAGGLRLGINVLRNDPGSALAIAVAVDAAFIRVNVHAGVYATDQGLIEGAAADTLRLRRSLQARVAVLADVHVKHARPVSHDDLVAAAEDTAYRGLADGLIVTGSATGKEVDPEHVRLIRQAVPDRRLFIGSGATAETVADLLALAGSVIVGSSIKYDGLPENQVDPERAHAFSRAAGRPV